MRVFRTILAASVTTGLLVAPLAAEPISVRVQNADLEPDQVSYEPAVSANGKTIVFASDATNFSAQADGELFTYDVVSDKIRSLMGPNDGNVFQVGVSANGRYAVFSTDGNLASSDTECLATNAGHDVLWVDTAGVTPIFKRVSRPVNCGNGAGQDPAARANSTSDYPTISGDGNYVAFFSYASNLVATPVTQNRGHIFEMNMTTRAIRLVSANPVTGAQGDSGSSELEKNAMSSDGTKIVFTTNALNLAPAGTVNAGNVFDVLLQTINRQTGAVTFENMNRNLQTGAAGNLSSENASISPNGRFVIFLSSATNVLPEGRSASGLIVRDLVTPAMRAVPLPQNMGRCTRGRVTDLGDAIIYCDPAVEAGTDVQQLFRVTAQGAVTLLSDAHLTGAYANATTGNEFTVSADGRLVATESNASNLAPGDTAGKTDIYMMAEPEFFDELFRDGFE